MIGEDNMTDEDKMIKKLMEHRDLIELIVLIGKKNGIDIEKTRGNDSNGDFRYPKEKKEELIKVIDETLGHRKYKKIEGDK